MKEEALKLFLLLFIHLYFSYAFAQNEAQMGSILKTDVAVKIDGKIDEMWNYEEIETYKISRNWPNETISMMDGLFPYWKGIWDTANTYILVYVPDDNCYKVNESSVLWLADRVELYFDVNPDKVEDIPIGPSSEGSGHYQFVADFVNNYDSIETAYSIDSLGQAYVYEFKIPHNIFFDKDSNQFQPVEDVSVIGFDVTVVDLDKEGEGSNVEIGRVNWSNNVAVAGESWNNLDMAGDVEYSSLTDCKCGSSIEDLLGFANVYPNPSNGVFTLEGTEKINQIKVFDMQGRLVYTKEVHAIIYTIDLSNQKAGIYYIKTEGINITTINQIIVY